MKSFRQYLAGSTLALSLAAMGTSTAGGFLGLTAKQYYTPKAGVSYEQEAIQERQVRREEDRVTKFLDGCITNHPILFDYIRNGVFMVGGACMATGLVLGPVIAQRKEGLVKKVRK